MRHVAITILVAAASVSLLAQDSTQATSEFEVVSIKRHVGTDFSMNINGSRDGSSVMTNVPIRSVIASASPVPLRDVIGLPDWVTTERYDISAKAPPGVPPGQFRAMWQALLADRFKMIAHTEQRERDVYLLVMARHDGRLGPQIKPSTLDCTPRPGATPPLLAAGPNLLEEQRKRCGLFVAGPTVVSGGVTLDQLARFLTGAVDGQIENRTGLDGFYAVELTFARIQRASATPDVNAVNEPPDVFTAVQEQIGLKLQRERKMMPVFVVDHIERPSEN